MGEGFLNAQNRERPPDFTENQGALLSLRNRLPGGRLTAPAFCPHQNGQGRPPAAPRARDSG